jgi:hypothetical protein
MPCFRNEELLAVLDVVGVIRAGEHVPKDEAVTTVYFDVNCVIVVVGIEC